MFSHIVSYRNCREVKVLSESFAERRPLTYAAQCVARR